jgi:hypothetical protein
MVVGMLMLLSACLHLPAQLVPHSQVVGGAIIANACPTLRAGAALHAQWGWQHQLLLARLQY